LELLHGDAHQQQTFSLYGILATHPALLSSEQHRLRNLLLDQQLRQEQLQQRQRLEQTLLRRGLEMQPGLFPGPALQLQLQRFRQEEASQQLHFKLQWDLR